MRSLREIYDDLHELKIKEAGFQMELAMLRGDKGNAHWWLTWWRVKPRPSGRGRKARSPSGLLWAPPINQQP